MIPTTPPLRRRALSRGLLGLAAAGLAKNPSAHGQATVPALPFPEGTTLTVAGPEDGALDAWARLLIPALGRFLPPGIPFRRVPSGGLDGITGANQFAAQAHPDGSAALLVPGLAALGWLSGDPRVQFDLGRWVPVLGAFYQAVLVGRADLAQLAPGQKLRIGLSAPHGPELAAVLGLERLGLVTVPVPGLVDPTLVRAAFAQNAVDVMLLRGPHIATTLSASQARPICVLGLPDDSGALSRDPDLPQWPHLGELLGGLPNDPLSAGWRALAVAAQLAFGLVLPQLTPAAMIALWRRAAEQAAALPAIQATASMQAVRMHTNPDAISMMASDLPALTALRSWFADRSAR